MRGERWSLVGAWCFLDHYGPLLGAQLDLAPDAQVILELDSKVEHGGCSMPAP
ncbi:hypothetical protein [Calidifontibacter indicus]|uniref:hypothetical protein n=1 Tax=Calidifontibacter indicus TaxID=419650 RepID=UPI001473963B|nr:hypothetical protein [Calidifontibacter indicus]